MDTKYAYDITVSDDKSMVTLRVELPRREKARDPILEMDDTNAVELLRAQGFNNYNLVRSAPRLSNWVNRDGNGGVSAGEWLFENKDAAEKEAKPAAKKPAAKKTTAKKKTTTTS